MTHVFRFLIDTLFPPHDDVSVARRVREEEIAECASIEKTPTGAYAALPYRNPHVRALIRANKFYGDRRAATLLASVLFDLLVYIEDEYALEPRWKAPLIVPIPSSPEKKRERGYNQVERVIERLPKETLQEGAYAPHVLARHHRESQARIDTKERAKNISGAFFVPKKCAALVRGKAVLLIDDVTESSATLLDATRALKEAGAVAVMGVALAK